MPMSSPAGADGYLRFAASRPELQPTMLFNSPRHRRLCRDRLAQDARQRFDRIRLLDQLETAIGVLGENVAVTRGEHDRQARIAFADDAGELDAVHAGHDDVGEDEID